jgi:hypothetical protein
MRLLICALMHVVLASVAAAESVPNPDALEKELLACITDKVLNGKCAENYLGKRVLPGNEKLVTTAAQLDGMLKQWLATETIFKVHPISVDKRGGIFEKRVYLIEDSSGSLMMMNVSLLKRLDSWYVWKFEIGSTKEAIESVLLGPRADE